MTSLPGLPGDPEIVPHCTVQSCSQCLTDVGIAYSEVQKEGNDEETVNDSSGGASRKPESAVNSNTEGGQKSDKGPSEEELELIAALERANKALEEEAKAAKATKQEEELVAALERANQGRDRSKLYWL